MMDKKRKKENPATKFAKENSGIFGIGARALAGRAERIERGIAGKPPKYTNK